jgi:putative acetyltransferase
LAINQKINMDKLSNLIFSTASSPIDYEQVKNIFIEYQQFLNVDLCFQSFEKELLNLDTIYKSPRGTIILAKNNDEIVATVALKPIEENNCEMKRLYVKPEFRGLGIGEKLVTELIQFAKEANFDKMKLDTLTRLTAAVKLYRKFGFIETKPYVYNPLDEVLYFEKTL